MFISETMGPGFTNTTYSNVEYSPAEDSQLGPFTMRRVNYGKGDERGAAFLFRPARPDGSPVAKGAGGSLRIAGLDVVDTKGPVFALNGVSEAQIDYVRGRNINLSPSGIDGFVGGFGQVVNSGQVEIYEARLFGTSPLPINLSSVDRLRLRNVSNVVAPTSGAAMLDVDTGGTVSYTPSVTNLNTGLTIAGATVTGDYTVKEVLACVGRGILKFPVCLKRYTDPRASDCNKREEEPDFNRR